MTAQLRGSPMARWRELLHEACQGDAEAINAQAHERTVLRGELYKSIEWKKLGIAQLLAGLYEIYICGTKPAYEEIFDE